MSLPALPSRTTLAVACPQCGDLTEQPLSSLKRARRVDCAVCGYEIDVSRGEIRAEIEVIFASSMRERA
jgi:ribosomal protein S27E